MDEVAVTIRGRAVIRGGQARAAARQPADDHRHGEHARTAVAQHAPALREAAYRVGHVLERVRVDYEVERAVGVRQRLHVELRKLREHAPRQLREVRRNAPRLVDLEHGEPPRRAGARELRERACGAGETEDCRGERHAAQRAAAARTVPSLLPVHAGDFVGREAPLGDQRRRQHVDVDEALRAAHDAA
ncbi:MAG: hypothetical protein IPM22_04170 [Betaproteobacteria bacterium]|nr:hypothetical protein [Betaproteobacteria bacterium]